MRSHIRSAAVPRAVSLFSGAMGLDLGLELAGFRICLAVESNPEAAETIRINRPDLPLIDQPIEALSTSQILEKADATVGEIDLLAGGPACQSFSTAGRRQSVSDPRGKLFFDFMRVVDEAKPRFFVIENVRGLLSAAVKHRPLAERGAPFPPLAREEELGSAFEKITDRFRESGYYVLFDVLNAADFGSPQTRQRLVMIGSRDGTSLSMPHPSHAPDGLHGLKRWRSLREALAGLHDEAPEYVPFAPSQRDYFALVPAGGNWRDLPDHEKPTALGAASKSWGGRSGFFRRLDWNRPSPTLNTDPAAKATALCHPDELRPLSVREYARIQGFPDEWTVYGSTRAKYRQFGNAVPVDLAAAIGSAIRQSMVGRSNRNLFGKVECHNLTLLNALSRRPATRLNPPRMRVTESTPKSRGSRGRPAVRDDAMPYTPPHFVTAVGKTNLAKRITRQLEHIYGSPSLGNFNDPVDELFFIILSQRTTGPSYESTFKQFRQQIGDWDNLPNQSVEAVSRIISRAGLSNQKAAHFLKIAHILRMKFGGVTLDPLRRESNQAIEAFLTTLPGVGEKTAKCVMMFSMGRNVLPVDTHVARVSKRIGLVNPQFSKSRTPEVLEQIVPLEMRYSFHVNVIAHGRAICRARNPLCEHCPVSNMCQEWINQTARKLPTQLTR